MHRLGLYELRGFGKAHFCVAWLLGSLCLPALAVSSLPGMEATAERSGLLLCVLLAPVTVVAIVRALLSPVAHTLLGRGNPGFPLYLWSLPRGVQVIYAGAGLVGLVCAGTGRSELGAAAFMSLVSSLLVLMRASAGTAGAPV